MSKKNIIRQEEVGKDLHVTFDTASGPMTYKFVGNSRRAFERGTDPARLSGVLVKEKKKK